MKLKNKGFTLIELLAVIVILAILVTVSVPAVTKYLAGARKDTFATNAQAAISAVRNDYLAEGESGDKVYKLEAINALLDKKLQESSYGDPYLPDSYISATVNETTGVVTYHICITDGKNGIDADESNISSDAVLTTVVSCTAP